jgi:hypothetical protein
LHGGLPNQRDILRPHPREHARALNAERDPAATPQGVYDSRGVARAAFTAYSLGLFAPVVNHLHPFLKSERLPLAQSLCLSNERWASLLRLRIFVCWRDS